MMAWLDPGFFLFPVLRMSKDVLLALMVVLEQSRRVRRNHFRIYTETVGIT
jgi:hypothetical protein